MVTECAAALRTALAAHHSSAIELFQEWDADGSGTVSRQEFRSGFKQLGLDAQWETLFDHFDRDHSGSIEYDELVRELLHAHVRVESADVMSALHRYLADHYDRVVDLFRR